MLNIEADDLDELFKWLDFIVNKRDVYIESEDIHLKIFGEGNESYLIVNCYLSVEESIEYYFKPDESAYSLEIVLNYIKLCDYSLSQLIKNLGSLDFKYSEAGYYASVDKGRIFKLELTST